MVRLLHSTLASVHWSSLSNQGHQRVLTLEECCSLASYIARTLRIYSIRVSIGRKKCVRNTFYVLLRRKTEQPCLDHNSKKNGARYIHVHMANRFPNQKKLRGWASYERGMTTYFRPSTELKRTIMTTKAPTPAIPATAAMVHFGNLNGPT